MRAESNNAAGPAIRPPAGGRRPPAPRIAFFGHDCRESTVRKRIAALQAQGCDVVGFTFERPRADGRPAECFFENVPLGTTRDRNYARRLPALAAALPRILARADALRGASAIWARNIDMLALAAAAKVASRAHAPLVYEALDVQRVFTRKGAVPAAFRAAERRLLAASALLVVSAPEFVERYFTPVQGFSGPWALVENRIARAQLPTAPRAVAVRGPGSPVTIGWYGVLRCTRSLALLDEIAGRLGPRVRIVLRGRLSEEDIPRAALEAVLSRRPSLAYEGPYRSPDDLAAIYGDIDFAWAVDYTDEGANSDWLLPNRLYEGGYYGTPALARAGTATGRMVEEAGLGLALPEPLVESVCALVDGLEADAYRARRARLAALPERLFVDDGEEHRAILDRLGIEVPA